MVRPSFPCLQACFVSCLLTAASCAMSRSKKTQQAHESKDAEGGTRFVSSAPRFKLGRSNSQQQSRTTSKESPSPAPDTLLHPGTRASIRSGNQTGLECFKVDALEALFEALCEFAYTLDWDVELLGEGSGVLDFERV